MPGLELCHSPDDKGLCAASAVFFRLVYEADAVIEAAECPQIIRDCCDINGGFVFKGIPDFQRIFIPAVEAECGGQSPPVKAVFRRKFQSFEEAGFGLTEFLFTEQQVACPEPVVCSSGLAVGFPFQRLVGKACRSPDANR